MPDNLFEQIGGLGVHLELVVLAPDGFRNLSCVLSLVIQARVRESRRECLESGTDLSRHEDGDGAAVYSSGQETADGDVANQMPFHGRSQLVQHIFRSYGVFRIRLERCFWSGPILLDFKPAV